LRGCKGLGRWRGGLESLSNRSGIKEDIGRRLNGETRGKHREEEAKGIDGVVQGEILVDHGKVLFEIDKGLFEGIDLNERSSRV
jgi:hypothetical protein